MDSRNAAAALAVLAGTAMSHHALGQSTDPFTAQFQLSSLAAGDGTNGFVLNGSVWSVSTAGDVNGDGIDDLLIGALDASPNGISRAGESYVVFGAANLGSGGVGTGGSFNLSALNGPNGFALNGIDANDYSGGSVSSAGDINGDGIDDLLIGAVEADPNGIDGAGESYVVFGAADLGSGGVGTGGSFNLSTLNGPNGFVLNGINTFDSSGYSVSSAGDVNSDGIDDLIIGSTSGGGSHVVFGATDLGTGGVGTGGSFNLSALNGPNGFILNEISANKFSHVSSAGDVNGDGIDDLLISADSASPNGITGAGQSYVVFGATDLGTGGVGTGGSFNLTALNGPNGFALNGIGAFDLSGISISSAGDINADGIDDLIIGSESGGASVVFGSPDLGTGGVGTGGSFDLASLNGPNGFTINGIVESDLAANCVSSAGDINGDGIDDLLIGARFASPNGNSAAGKSYVVFGATDLGTGGVGTGGSFEISALNGPNGFALNGIDTNDNSGSSASSAGDVNGDGIDDLLIGAIGAGESYLVFGRANANVWTSPVGGSFATGSNWRSGSSPTSGIATIDTPLGVTVTGPAGAVFLDALNLGATLGRTTLDLQPGSLLSLENPFILPASAALTGSGLFAANDMFTNHGLIRSEDLALIAAEGLTNHGDIDLSALDVPSGFVRLQAAGAISNESDGEIVLRRGSVELQAPDGIVNNGTMSVVFATADILAGINNTASGSVSISGASSLLITDDVTNASTITLTDDSSLVILGAIFGNGVSGPGGAGTAGSVYVEGGVIPGLLGNPFGTARFDGDLDLGLAAYTVIEVGGTTPGLDLDQIDAAGHLGVGGTLEVQIVNGYVPQVGDVYQVLDFATTGGGFSSIVLDPALISAGADTSELLTTGRIRIPNPCPADFNGDGITDFGDIDVFIDLFVAQDAAADLNGDGIIDFGDINTFIPLFLDGC